VHGGIVVGDHDIGARGAQQSHLRLGKHDRETFIAFEGGIAHDRDGDGLQDLARGEGQLAARGLVVLASRGRPVRGLVGHGDGVAGCGFEDNANLGGGRTLVAFEKAQTLHVQLRGVRLIVIGDGDRAAVTGDIGISTARSQAGRQGEVLIALGIGIAHDIARNGLNSGTA
jgi:hypothetical protein